MKGISTVEEALKNFIENHRKPWDTEEDLDHLINEYRILEGLNDKSFNQFISEEIEKVFKAVIFLVETNPDYKVYLDSQKEITEILNQLAEDRHIESSTYNALTSLFANFDGIGVKNKAVIKSSRNFMEHHYHNILRSGIYKIIHNKKL